MAGKPKNVLSRDEVSKTARASQVRTATKGLQTDVDVPRLIPLGNGTGAYLRHPLTGHTKKYRINDHAFVEELRSLLLSPVGHQLKSEIAELSAIYNNGWVRVRELLFDSMV